MKKIDFMETVKDSATIVVKNILPLCFATLLWFVTLWIPYINLGTTIALTAALPAELAKGKMINPLFIFDSKYRQFMGEYLVLEGLMLSAIVVAAMFMIVPAFVLALSWILSAVILLDKQVSPIDAMMMSNKIMYGNKWIYFGIQLVISLCVMIVNISLGQIPYIGILFSILMSLITVIVSQAITASVYRQLVLDEEKPADAPATEETVVAEA